MTTRTYTKTKRATKEQETHQKIIDAAIGLYGSVGPAATTISAVATNASVQRLTVYRHFPKEADLMAGALTEWFEANPMPGPSDWRDNASMENWPIAILSMLYGYYRETSVLWRGLFADRGKFAELDKFLDLTDAHLKVMQDDMMRSLPTARRTNALCQAVVRHSVQFSTWQSFSDSQLDTVEIAALMEDWVQKSPLG